MLSTKRKIPQENSDVDFGQDDLFKQVVVNSDDDDDLSDDSTDSEESYYSGLEEPDTTEDEDSEEDPNSGAESEGFEINDGEDITKLKISTEQEKASREDEYEFDSSDEEDIRNTVGNIPMEWYRDYKHIGYDQEGKKLIKPKQGDELDEFIAKTDDPNYWRTVKDKSTGQNVVLSDKDLELIQNIRKGKHPGGTDPYEPWIDFFTFEKRIHPVTNRPEHKRSFIPSHLERLKVGKLTHALKMGWIKPRKLKKDPDDEDEDDKFYMLWQAENEGDVNKRHQFHIPAPKMALPGHAESYNPPPEYIFTDDELKKWKEQEKEDRRIDFIPKKFDCLRHVPGFNRFIKERFERCLDLYLCPRQRKMRMNVDPEDLIPNLPKPKDLQPFPTVQSLVYKGHEDLVRCISIDPTGQWFASASDDCTVKFWEVSTGRCMKTLKVGERVKSVAWTPNPSLCLVAFTVEKSQEVVIVNPGLGDKLVLSTTDSMIENFVELEDDSSVKKIPVNWHQYTDNEYEEGYRIKITHPKEVTQVVWHVKGDYFSAVMPQGDNMSVLIHQLSKRRSQNPFKKSKGLVQKVLFHPTRPYFFVATQRHVRVYNLLKQELTKKLMTNCKWVSSMAVHPGGDNLIIGSYDCRLSWFDLDLSLKPYQTLRHHKKAIRSVAYHNRYPLFASASDDCSIIVCHGMVYSDLLQNPLIVPVKILKGHEPEKSLGALDCQFHPTQPWIFSSGSDSTIRLFT